MTTLQKPLRAAVLGCGRMGLQTLPKVRSTLPSCWLPLSHAEAVDSHPGLELVALCDPFPAPRANAVTKYPDVPVYSDPVRMLSEVGPDVVCIATRTPERPFLINLCLEYGVRRFHLEKPLCRSSSELNDLSSQLLNHNAHCTFGALRRYLPPYLFALKLLNSGRIGCLKEVHAALGFARLCWTQIHSIDLIAAFLAPALITEVRAVAEPSSFSVDGFLIDGDPIVRCATFHTSEGPQGLISAAGGCDLMLHGDSGMLTVLNDGKQLLSRHSPSPEDPYYSIQKFLDIPEASHLGTAAALDRLVNTNPEIATMDTKAMLQAQTLLLACAQSILEDGRPVDPTNLHPSLSISGRSGELFA